MNLWDSVRRIGEGAQIEEGALLRARKSLDEEIARPARGRARLAWLIGGGAAAVLLAGASAAVAVTLITPSDDEPVTAPSAPPSIGEEPFTASPTPTAEAEPQHDLITVAGVTAEAAALAPVSTGSVLQGGRTLKVEVHGDHLSLWAADGDPVPSSATRVQASAAWIYSNTYTTYLPSDRSAEWVRDLGGASQIIAHFGEDAPRLSEEFRQQFAWIESEDRSVRSRGGIGQPGDEAPRYSDAAYAAMPRDPHDLLAYLGADGEGDDMGVFVGLADELQTNAAPVELRAAMFTAVSLITGVTIQGVSGQVVTLGYTADVEYTGLWTETVSIDLGTGLVVATSRTIGADGGVVPDDVPNYRSRIVTTVVDAIP
jgi:hypothetical protein